jgi:hypothetical protein
MTVRSNHNSLLNYFLYDKKDLSPAYVRKCEEFIDSLGSSKQQAIDETVPHCDIEEATSLPQSGDIVVTKQKGIK